MTPHSRLHGLPPSAIHSVVAAARALEIGDSVNAEAQLGLARLLNPDHPEVLRLHAGILNLKGERKSAFDAMQRALELRPDDALYHNTMATVLAEADDFKGSIEALRRACALQPDLVVAWYNLGIMLIRCVRYEEALNALHRTILLAPDHMQARAQLADMLRVTDHADEAVVEYRKILASQPWLGMAWWGLANIKTVRAAAGDIEKMRAALNDSRGNDDDRVATGFALAKALDNEGSFSESMNALRQANEKALNIMRSRGKLWNRAAFSESIDSITSSPIPDLTTNAGLGREVIFIVGLPRSGTTLAEQILASHSRVEGAGELPEIPLLVTEGQRRHGKAYSQWLREMNSQDWRSLGERYLRHTDHWRRSKGIFTDKLPGNWMYIGVIRAMLPDAKIICCRRDPLETCFSCYRHFFQGNEYTRSFDDLAAYWRDYDRSVRYWRGLFPSHVYEHTYEDLVADSQASIRKLLDFCGLPFEEACLNFHRTQRDVRSPSAMQVRQPLKLDTARASSYGALLDPLREALRRAQMVD